MSYLSVDQESTLSAHPLTARVDFPGPESEMLWPQGWWLGDAVRASAPREGRLCFLFP